MWVEIVFVKAIVKNVVMYVNGFLDGFIQCATKTV